MKTAAELCTCRDTKCPLHPTNHDKGCTPCIEKNLARREIPSCFFRALEHPWTKDSYFFRDFAQAVLDDAEAAKGEKSCCSR